MFGIHFRQLYRTCDKVIIRNLRSRRLDTRNPNPGLDRQIKAFEADGLRVKEENLEEFVEQSESDFYNVGEAYNEHQNETLIGKYELRHHIVKEKYFKENMPNLLTWSEKEQIRHLASTEPDEWTPEKIAESFPITEQAAKKLLKFPWKPATEQRIARHDASVMRNWKELKEGSLDIPPELRNHFLKFSNRTIPPLSQKSVKIDITPEQDLGEFEQIVRKCAAKESKDNFTEQQSSNLALPSPHSSKPQNKKFREKSDSKLITLDELTSKIKNRLEKGSEVDINDKIIINSTQAPNQSITERVQADMELFHESHKKNDLVEYKTKSEEPNEIMNYPERIRIPKNAYKKGATYKVNDCYYDHDGRFLYRVLGMSQ
ncbi:hypothetical protein PYW08_002772 [Mythimna loreyi]|uniref:Uncharacterized protein n=1 Tax=Mythimna loreyi TaxID=667449 RepID=A0ACC2QKX2_9NEOP|nr:hypothetical protein PYW08_002772 [Mythimna loreyi]